MTRHIHPRLYRPAAFLFVVIVSVLVIAVSRRMPKRRQAASLPVPSPMPTATLTPAPTPVRYMFPANSFAAWEGDVWIDATELNAKPVISSFTLHLKPTGAATDTAYPVGFGGSADWVGDPSVSYGASYGCVQLQASGYVGYLVFNVKTGEKIAAGPQYSACIQWIDGTTAIIMEQPYDTKRVTYFLYNAATGARTVLTAFDASRYDAEISALKKVYKDDHVSFEYPASWTVDPQPEDADGQEIRFWACKRRVVSLVYRPVAPGSAPRLGSKNPFGPPDQTSSGLTVAGRAAGLNIQPAHADGGYEPGYTVDFLADSGTTHVYLASFAGCAGDSDITYTEDIKPILQSLRLYR